MRLQEPEYGPSATGYSVWDYPDALIATFLNRVRQGTAWRTRPILIQQLVNDLDQALARCRQEGSAHKVGDPPIEIRAGQAPMQVNREDASPNLVTSPLTETVGQRRARKMREAKKAKQAKQAVA